MIPQGRGVNDFVVRNPAGSDTDQFVLRYGTLIAAVSIDGPNIDDATGISAECDSFSVRRPAGIAVIVGVCCELSGLSSRNRHEPNRAVHAEGDLAAIRRPGRGPGACGDGREVHALHIHLPREEAFGRWGISCLNLCESACGCEASEEKCKSEEPKAREPTAHDFAAPLENRCPFLLNKGCCKPPNADGYCRPRERLASLAAIPPLPYRITSRKNAVYTKN